MAIRRVLLTTAAITSACATAQYGASDANLGRARAAAPEGAALYGRHCAGCHGERGESATSAPRVLGKGALPEYPRARNTNADPATGDPASLRLQAQARPAGAPWRDPFRTAADLHGYVSENMPPARKDAAPLAPADYWAIVHFMLLAHGVEVPSAGLGEANASAVRLSVQ